MKCTGKQVWLDVEMERRNEAAMQEAAQNSKCIVAIVTGPCFEPEDLMRTGDAVANSYFKRELCLKELRWACEASVPIQPVVARDDKAKIGEFIKQLPADLQNLSAKDFKTLDDVGPEQWKTSINEVMQGVVRLSICMPRPDPRQAKASAARTNPRWIPGVEAPSCMWCDKGFNKVWNPKHHCRSCGWAVCDACSQHRVKLHRWLEDKKPHELNTSRSADKLRVCDGCHAQHSARASLNAKVGTRVEEGVPPAI